MAKQFHETKFDDATQIKLEVFRGYIRKWIPVFLVARKDRKEAKTVNLFDFFAGPGDDAAGNPGSPRIIQDELRQFCQTHDDMKAEGVVVKLYFNDKLRKHTDELQRCLGANACPKGCCEFVFSSKPFQEAIADRLPILQHPGSANLVIMDQFGVKEVTPEVIESLARCGTTDILFFISSSYVRRFAGELSIQRHFHMSAEQLAASEYKSIHRHICHYFRTEVAAGIDYHLAPFSIKKQGNIYGIIFGSRSLLGLQKFLEVCWALDGVTGEANYDIDDDPVRQGGTFLFAEMNVIKKQDGFRQELELFLQAQADGTKSTRGVTNLDVYRFTLEKGFLPTHTNASLRALQGEGRLDVTDPASGQATRRGAFYLNWESYKEKDVKAVFRLKD